MGKGFEDQMESMMEDPKAPQMRTKCLEYMKIHSYESAMFFARQLVCLSDNADDVQLLAEAYIANQEYRRAYNELKERNTLSKGLRFRYLAALCQSKCDEWQECIDTLGGEDGNDFVDPVLDAEVTTAKELLLGKAHQKLQNRIKAKESYQAALMIDSTCSEAFDALVDNHLLSASQERELVSTLSFTTDQEWIRLLYISRLQKYNANEEAETYFQPLERDCGLALSIDVGRSRAEYYFYRSEFRKCLELTKTLLLSDPYHPSVMPVHLSVMVELGEKTDLFYCAHKLVDAYPKSAVAWYAVGCYYFAISKYDMARRYFSKATHLDSDLMPAWIAFGNSFAAQDESDQAMAAYRTSLRLSTGSHLPFLYTGMEYLRNNNLRLAHQQFRHAQEICATDPLVLNEIGVALYLNQEYVEAIEIFQNALMLSKSDNHVTWEPTLFNLGHTHRKLRQYDDAVSCYEQCLSICPRKASTYSALGFTQQLQGHRIKAIEYYHKALGLDSEDSFAAQMLSKTLSDNLRM